MKCYYHPDLESTNSCSVCRRFLCLACSHSVKGRIYCQDCLVQGAELAALANSPKFANYSPGRAALFALIPGMGAVYNRQYVKAITHFGFFAALLIVADHGPDIFGLAAFAFYIFTIIDAYRSAQVILRHQVLHPGLAEEETQDEIQLPVWGATLVLLGLLFFLNNLGVISLQAASQFLWPLIFVGAGIYLILYYFIRTPKKPSEGSYYPPVPPSEVEPPLRPSPTGPRPSGPAEENR